MLDQCRVVGGWTGADCCRELRLLSLADCCCLSLAGATPLCIFYLVVSLQYSVMLAASLVVSVAVRCLLRWRASGLSRKSPQAAR